MWKYLTYIKFYAQVMFFRTYEFSRIKDKRKVYFVGIATCLASSSF